LVYAAANLAARLPEAVLREDPTILTYYDLAQMEEG